MIFRGELGEPIQNINRITVEFKCKWRLSKNRVGGILIESQWNLNDCNWSLDTFVP